jgi:hypothetical protein
LHTKKGSTIFHCRRVISFYNRTAVKKNASFIKGLSGAGCKLFQIHVNAVFVINARFIPLCKGHIAKYIRGRENRIAHSCAGRAIFDIERR